MASLPAGGGGPGGGMGLAEAIWAMPRWLGLGMDAMMSRMVRAVAGGGGVPGGGGPRGRPENLTREEQAVLDSAELYLARGRELKQWWERAWTANCFAQRFPLSTSYNRPDMSFGFFDAARVDGREMPILGSFQSLFYDQTKSPTADRAAAARWMRDQIREFVLHYFMRVSYFEEPQAYVPAVERQPPPALLRPFSLCFEENPSLVGFGFSQHFFKRSDNGEIGEFPQADRYAIVDLREVGPIFRWLLLHVDIFDFNFTYQPLGPGTPSLTFPLEEGSYLILDRTFVVDEEAPAPGVLGRYGFGYSFIKNPVPGLIAYGPGEFEAAIELITFIVYRDGKVRADAVFVANRPTEIARVPLNPAILAGKAASLATLGVAPYVLGPLRDALAGLPFAGAAFDPVAAGIALANFLSGGLAAENLCLSTQQLEKIFLVKHFMQHYQTLEGSLQTWRQISNWLDAAALPRWVVTGRAGE
ncbi:MAG TPA: hypothetical protein VMW75_03970 [Thermoanaerobaculia bacterium]|nr:hypothetical protein [Thermoanaerobaculia bacterium]